MYKNELCCYSPYTNTTRVRRNLQTFYTITKVVISPSNLSLQFIFSVRVKPRGNKILLLIINIILLILYNNNNIIIINVKTS